MSDSGLSRRRFLAATAGLVAGGAAAGAGLASGAERESAAERVVRLPDARAGLPARQFAWTAFLATDEHGNAVSPRFDRLLFFDVDAHPAAGDIRRLEASLRSLEHAYAWGHDGLLFTASWGPHYFEHVLGVASPIPRAKELSEFELPTFDDYDLCLHLACDDEERLASVELALVHGRPLDGRSITLGPNLRWRETRTGFVGNGLPAARQHVNGIPAGDPVSKTSPLFMGFKSGFTKNQATEDDIAIASGSFANGTTMQVSYMRLRLDNWYDLLDDDARVERMYAPGITPGEVARFTDNPPTEAAHYSSDASRYGVVGHSQTSARARRNGRPLIIRRDFNTTDGGLAGLHFVSVQRSIADFVTTRNAMNAANASYINPLIQDTINNGINEFIFVLKRANYVIPSRAVRSYPLAPGQAAALA